MRSEGRGTTERRKVAKEKGEGGKDRKRERKKKEGGRE